MTTTLTHTAVATPASRVYEVKTINVLGVTVELDLHPSTISKFSLFIGYPALVGVIGALAVIQANLS